MDRFPPVDPAVASRVLNEVRGCTFDDFIFSPQSSVLERRDPAVIDLSCRLSRRIVLKRPVVSANMDTVTRAPMAIVQAEEGGIGIIDRGFRPGEIEPQVREVGIVKRTQHGVIADPFNVSASATLDEAASIMRRSGVGSLVVVDGSRRLLGLLTERDMRFVPREGLRVADRMTPVDRLVVHPGPITPDAAQRLMAERKVKKLPLVDEEGILMGLVTARDLLRQRRLPFATRDAQGRLRVGAAIGATGDYLERAAELIRTGVDVLVIDIAHGHSIVMDRALAAFRARFGDFELIAGNVATADGATFLLERGADAVKVGIGPGGGCTTRMTTSFGVPQVQALVECRRALSGSDVSLIADGGVKRHGAIFMALMFGGDSVMLGSAFAGTEESPGEIVQKSVVLPESQKTVKVPFKVLRGMASLTAIRDRLDVEDADKVELEAIGAEGMEISVPARGSARTIVRDMIKHLCSSISYGGAGSLAELREMFWKDPDRYLIRQSESARRESYER
ncbi:MAG: IMP dehydrogenase [Acidobacteria bacterium]|nr:IMP dehydrogenase [Acidobacteriota bacterium]MBA3885666.1 IMP dehydrogenase [Acidobacteriota bacterium]